MIAAGIIAFREGLEAALIIGIVLGYLSKIGRNDKKRLAWAGVAAAVILSLVIALAIQAVGAELDGPAEPVFEGLTMFVAVIMLTWMIVWMRWQARSLKSNLEYELQSALSNGQGRALFLATFVAVFREGIETALFLSAAAFATDGFDTLVGGIVGLVIAALVGYLLYGATVRLNLRTFFNVTSVLLLVFAAGMFARGIGEFQEVGLLPVISEHVYDLSALVSADTTLGQVLEALVGYNPSPSLLQVIGYWAYWGLALFGVPWLVNRRIEQADVPIQQAAAKL
ncbi:MAG: iron uptake transporter permease EfeU [Chloroflexota bacterium]